MSAVTRNFGEDVWQSVTEETNGKRRLKSEVVDCILTKLGPGAQHIADSAIDTFNVPPPAEEVEEGEIPQMMKVVVGNFGVSPFVMSMTSDPSAADSVVNAIEQCHSASQTAAARRKSKKTRKTRKSRKTKKSTRRR